MAAALRTIRPPTHTRLRPLYPGSQVTRDERGRGCKNMHQASWCVRVVIPAHTKNCCVVHGAVVCRRRCYMTAFAWWVTSRFPRLPLFPPMSTHLHTARALYTQPSRLPVPMGRHPGHCTEP